MSELLEAKEQYDRDYWRYEISNRVLVQLLSENEETKSSINTHRAIFQSGMAKIAVGFADALLKELEEN